MRILLLTFFLVIGSTGTMLGKAAERPKPNPNSENYPKLVADIPIPHPNSKNCPKLVADIPIPHPDSKNCPKLVG